MPSYRILDLTDEKGLLCTKLLADLGADVIKIERPGGDPCRNIPPFFNDISHPEKSLYFWYYNTSKRSITLNLEIGRGQELFRNLIATADVLVETYQQGYLEKLGLGYQTLSQINPGLVVASITDFGRTGLYRDYKSSDIVASALGGWMYVCGDKDTPPLKPFGNQAYHVASIFAAVGILLSLWSRQSTGQGQHVDISVLECVAATTDHILARYFSENVIPQREGNRHWSRAFHISPTRDGYVVLAPFLQWQTLVEWLDSEGMAEDLGEPKWQDPNTRLEEIDHIIEVLGKWTKTHTVAELVESGQLMHFPWAEVTSVPQVVSNPQLRERSFFVELEHPELGGKYQYPGAPYHFSHSRWQLSRAPLIGEHNKEIYKQELGLSKEELITLVAEGCHLVPGGGILEGIRIIDFTRVLAGPYATRILADFGAEVIKVQMPHGEAIDSSGYYSTWNRNKLGITLDLSKPRGIEIARKLISVSDVVVENFSPRVMANWGLDYSNLRQMKPDIIMVSLSAVGQTGPWRNYIGFGPTIQAFSGITHLTTFPGLPPLGLGYSYADHIAGLFSVLAILHVLEQRRHSGKGEYIDISQLEAMCTLLGTELLNYMVNGRVTLPEGNRSSRAAPHGAYPCKGDDQWCAIAVSTEAEWQAFCNVLGNPPWAREKKFVTLSDRIRNVEELDSLVGKWTRQHIAEEVMHMMQKAGVAAGVVQDAHELANDPQLQARGFFIQLPHGVPEKSEIFRDNTHPQVGKISMDGTPLKLSATPAQFCRSAPTLGHDNYYVLHQLLGISQDEIAEYKEQEIIK